MDHRDLDQIRERMKALADAAIPAASPPAAPTGVRARSRASTMVPRLVAASFAVLALSSAALIWMKRDSKPSTVATSPSAPATSTTTSPPLVADPLPTLTSPGAQGNGPQADVVILQSPELTLAHVESGRDDFAWTSLLIWDGVDPAQPVAIVSLPEGEFELPPFGLRPAIGPRVTGFLVPVNEDGVGGMLSWQVGETWLHMNARGFTHEQMADLAARVVLDEAKPGGLSVVDLVPPLRADVVEGGNPESVQSYCGANGSSARISTYIGDARLAASLLWLHVPDVFYVETALGPAWYAPEFTLLTATVVLDDGRVVVMDLHGIVDGEGHLDDLTTVDAAQWNNIAATLDPSAAFTGCAGEGLGPVDLEPQPEMSGPLIVGPLTEATELAVQACDGAALSDEVPERVGADVLGAPHLDTAEATLASFIAGWNPRDNEHWPHDMPDSGWWSIKRGPEVRAFGWSSGSDEPPSAFNVVVHAVKLDDGWTVAGWEASGC